MCIRDSFSMWAITSAPLLTGHDVHSAPAALTAIVTNPTVISVNQQYAGNAGDLITSFNSSAVSTVTQDVETWAKPLPNGAVAVAVLCRATVGNFSAIVDFEDFPGGILNRKSIEKCDVMDLWSEQKRVAQSELRLQLTAQSVHMLRIENCSQGSLEPT
eukprot:TRINITY_DN12843_c0_g2_i1.p1 TRINITY_DN12843_c0_g2~~TRINITY_DN12843_c0_g2_i1.p1  ORF type:complete len:159 (-),score=28.04 TRINITY_DN12843_c0_g2_i1:20-496(-)